MLKQDKSRQAVLHLIAVNSDLTRILLAAGRTTEDTFRRFYDLPCDSSFNLGSILLSTLE